MNRSPTLPAGRTNGQAGAINTKDQYRECVLDSMVRWVVLFRSRNRLDGYRQYIQRENGQWATFRTRNAARAYAFEKLGYISRRSDLRSEPHGWLSPKVVRVTITANIQQPNNGDK